MIPVQDTGPVLRDKNFVLSYSPQKILVFREFLRKNSRTRSKFYIIIQKYRLNQKTHIILYYHNTRRTSNYLIKQRENSYGNLALYYLFDKIRYPKSASLGQSSGNVADFLDLNLSQTHILDKLQKKNSK